MNSCQHFKLPLVLISAVNASDTYITIRCFSSNYIFTYYLHNIISLMCLKYESLYRYLFRCYTYILWLKNIHVSNYISKEFLTYVMFCLITFVKFTLILLSSARHIKGSSTKKLVDPLPE